MVSKQSAPGRIVTVSGTRNLWLDGSWDKPRLPPRPWISRQAFESEWVPRSTGQAENRGYLGRAGTSCRGREATRGASKGRGPRAAAPWGDPISVKNSAFARA